MKKDTLLIVFIVLLLACSIMFLSVSMFGEKTTDNYPLPIALACIAVANMLIVIRNRKKKSNENENLVIILDAMFNGNFCSPTPIRQDGRRRRIDGTCGTFCRQ